LVDVKPGLRVVDLGCGTGELTRRLADALPDSDVVGIDSSTEMLHKAAKQARPGLRFEVGRIEDVDGEWDLIFSHAALHWVDDHAQLLPRLLGRCRQLVVQMPSNHEHASHRGIRETEAEFGLTPRHVPVLPLPDYAEILYAAGGRDLVVFEKVYPHVLPDADAVAEWTRGTALVPVLAQLSPPDQERFLQRYRERMRAAMPGAPVFFGFRRILFSARRGVQ
jgi:trans-aconitate 2-methyltransferase